MIRALLIAAVIVTSWPGEAEARRRGGRSHYGTSQNIRYDVRGVRWVVIAAALRERPQCRYYRDSQVVWCPY